MDKNNKFTKNLFTSLGKGVIYTVGVMILIGAIVGVILFI